MTVLSYLQYFFPTSTTIYTISRPKSFTFPNYVLVGSLSKKQPRPLSSDLQNRLRKDGIRPRKPRPRILFDMIYVDGFMDQA